MSQEESQKITILKIRKATCGNDISQAILEHAKKFWQKERKVEENLVFDGNLPLPEAFPVLL